VLEPIETAGLAKADIDTLRDRTRSAIEAAVTDMKG
jgi:hypothetical protein